MTARLELEKFHDPRIQFEITPDRFLFRCMMIDAAVLGSTYQELHQAEARSLWFQAFESRKRVRRAA